MAVAIPTPKGNAEVAVDGKGYPVIKMPGRATVNEVFHDRPHLIDQIRATGTIVEGQSTLHVRTKPLENGDLQILQIAAVARDPGRSDDYIDTLQDLKTTGRNRSTLVALYWNVYKNQGTVNNAVGKVSAILSAAGSFRVRNARKGKARKATETLTEVLYLWSRYVNSGTPSPISTKSDQPGVITGARGLKAINHQAVRYALVEGSWVGRNVWTSVPLGSLGTFDLPMTIQSLSTANLEPIRELVGTGIEYFYWVPPSALLNQIRNPVNSDIGKLIKKFIPKDLLNPLKKDGKVLLDPALLMHVKNRGIDTESFGESFIQPALPAIAYAEAITRLDLVSMQNLINRLTIVMVGKDDVESLYRDPDVVAARAELMRTFFSDPGPNMTVIWSGDDVEVKDVGADKAVLDLNERFKIAEQKIRGSLGVPAALMDGVAADGKAAGWAATIGAAAQLEELANQFAGIWTNLGERIALENGFTDIDLVYEWDKTLLVDKIEERNQNRNDYVAGLLPIRTVLQALGKDPDAEFNQMCFEKGLEPGTALWKDAFEPPEGLQGQGAGKVPGNGRTPDSQTNKTSPERPPEAKTPIENK